MSSRGAVTGREWTAEDVARLRQLWGSDTYRAIGRALGRTWKAVRRKGNSLGLGPCRPPARPWTPEEVAEALRLDAAGVKAWTIGRRVGRSMQAVQQKLLQARGARRPRAK